MLVRRVWKNYHTRLGLKRQTVAALRGTSFVVEEGEIFGLLGPNGAGKTTLLNSLVAEVRPTSGIVGCFTNTLFDDSVYVKIFAYVIYLVMELICRSSHFLRESS